jgi:hypothetical protein
MKKSELKQLIKEIIAESNYFSSNYELVMQYPSNDVFLRISDKKIGVVKKFENILTNEELTELMDSGFLTVDNRTGKAIEEYIKTGTWRLKKPHIVINRAIKEIVDKTHINDKKMLIAIEKLKTSNKKLTEYLQQN